MPIWRTASGDLVVVGSKEELEELAIDPVPDDLHRPYIDRVRVRHPETGEEATRVPEVLDVWFDSGSMPFAQWGYPQGEASEERFRRQFPADFICEAVDQTRGWFYSLLAVSTMLFGEASYKNCMVLGHILDAEGKKMSKSLGNVINPWDIFEKQGADALRWALFTSTSPGNARRFSVDQVSEAVRKYLLTLWNTYSFFVTYARIDGFDPQEDYVEPEDRSLMDRWALSELQLTVRTVTERLDAYDVTAAGRAIGEFVDELSNWYVRRSRRRFWKGEDDLDKKAAHSYPLRVPGDRHQARPPPLPRSSPSPSTRTSWRTARRRRACTSPTGRSTRRSWSTSTSPRGCPRRGAWSGSGGQPATRRHKDPPALAGGRRGRRGV